MPTRLVPIEACQPSQLLVSAEKLRAIFEWFDADDPAYDPLPVLRPDHLPTDVDVDARYVLADGHTRSLAAILCGAESLAVAEIPAAERREMELDVYARCLEWCVDDGIETPTDLVGRVVDAETHREEWIERCRAAATRPGRGVDRRGGG